MRRIVVIMAVTLALGGALAACGDDDGGGGGDDGAREPSKDVTEEPQAGTEEPEAPAIVQVGDTSLGEVLVDADGKTLYLFANDTGTTTGASDALQAAWPPLVVESEDELVIGPGLTAAVGTAMQADGRLWVTYNGHLLYRFSGDGAGGDTNGHKLGNVWFALDAEGNQLP